MKKQLFSLLFLPLLFSIAKLHAQNAPSIEWQKSLGGTSDDYASCIQQTTDGGFIVAGTTSSNDGDVSGYHDSSDCWIVKLDAAGNTQWQKSLGGSGYDAATSVQQITDGGFIVGGVTASNDGDVSGNHGEWDFWIVKLNSSGSIQWQKCLGGSDFDLERCLQTTSDGGFIVAGDSWSNDGEVTGNHGVEDYWIVKLDSIGDIEWQKSMGGSGRDVPHCINQTADGGFIVAGVSLSTNGDVSGNHGMDDYWIVKLDSSGNIQWQNSLGGSLMDRPYSIQQTTDDGFIVAGWTVSTDGDVSGNHGSNDCWIVKLNSSGNIQWQKCLGGSDADAASAIQQTADGGFIVGGGTSSTDGDITNSYGNGDYWIVKLDTSGNIQWQKSFGGSNGDGASSIQQTIDVGFIVAGGSQSNDGDVSGNHGLNDYWIVKLSAETGISSVTDVEMFSVYPNPAQSQLNITLAIPAEENNIHVFDLCGREISLPVSFHDNKAELNIAALPEGLYTIQITDKRIGKVGVGKFVKGD